MITLLLKICVYSLGGSTADYSINDSDSFICVE